MEFQIEIEITNNPEKNALKDEIDNSYEVKEMPEEIKAIRKGHKDNAVTKNHQHSIVIPQKAYTKTGAHEIGHMLYAEHDDVGIMTQYSNEENRTDEVTQNNINDILEHYEREQLILQIPEERK